MATLELSLDELHVINTVLQSQIDRERLLHCGDVPPMLAKTAAYVKRERDREVKKLNRALATARKQKANAEVAKSNFAEKLPAPSA